MLSFGISSESLKLPELGWIHLTIGFFILEPCCGRNLQMWWLSSLKLKGDRS